MIGAVSQVEAGPQDGTLLVTWQPVLRPPASGPVTGYAVYADGKKVTDVDSPTGDHALIDIGKLIGLNPKCVTVSMRLELPDANVLSMFYSICLLPSSVCTFNRDILS